jgi:hypothetical protein
MDWDLIYHGTMAGSALPQQKSELSPENLPVPLDDAEVLRRHVAKLYGQGWKRPQIARAMLKHLATNTHRPVEQQLSQVRKKLKRWEQSQSFRDLIWELAVVDLDLDSPAILRGIARSAKRGRVDAAKLSLEITGRHVTKGDQTAPNITIAFAGIPRPGPIQIADAEVVDEPSEDN